MSDIDDILTESLANNYGYEDMRKAMEQLKSLGFTNIALIASKDKDMSIGVWGGDIVFVRNAVEGFLEQIT
jgi:hypothetical protein